LLLQLHYSLYFGNKSENMNTSNPTILVIVGITGDLAKRKLLPAIAALAEQSLLPERFHLIGVTRQHGIALDTLLAMTPGASVIGDRITILQMELDQVSEYTKLATLMNDIEKGFGEKAKRVIYLSVPPTVSRGIVEHVGTTGMVADAATTVLMEKPFGTDYDDAKALAAHVQSYIPNGQLYRVDHYLAKHLVQEMVERSPDTSEITRIDIVASESLGIEGRANFYEQTGALRDLVQSHLLQFVAAALFDPTSPKDRATQRHEALQSLSVIPGSVVRGQYKGYREEVGNLGSNVETFVSMTLQSTLPAFTQVPITVATGKHLDIKKTSIIYTYSDGTTRDFTDKPIRPAEAYERIIHSAIVGKEDIFITAEDVLACWRIVTPIQIEWRDSATDLVFYAPGSTIAEVLMNAQSSSTFHE
jgi:glucose-6-phosphate 1-dehydrogenase